MSNQTVAKSARTIGFATLVSRFLGYFRDAVIANFFGTSMPAQAFVVAFRIPNMWRDLVGEGGANAAFIPVFSEYLTQEDRKEFWKLANLVFYIMVIQLVIIVSAGILLSPWIVRVMAPGFVKDADKLLLTVRLTQALFPYLLLVGLAAYQMGVLNSLGHFAAPAWGPAFLNVAVISSAFLFCHKIGIWGIVIGVLAGGLLQFVIPMAPLYRRGFRMNMPESLTHPGLKKIGKLFLPRILGAGVYQINLLIDTLFSSLGWVVGEGAVAAIYYSSRLIQLPLAIFGVSMATAALPAMSLKAAEKNFKELKDLVFFSLRSLAGLLLPVAAGFVVLGAPLVQVLFQRGKFDGDSAYLTSQALIFYALGLFSYSGVKILVSAFYAMQDTMTPVKVSAAALLVNVLLNFILMHPLRIAGLALATSISSMVNLTMLYLLLRKRLGPLGGRELCLYGLRALIVAGAAGLSMWVVFYHLLKPFHLLLKLPVSCIISVSAIIVFGRILKVKEAGEILNWMLRKR